MGKISTHCMCMSVKGLVNYNKNNKTSTNKRCQQVIRVSLRKKCTKHTTNQIRNIFQ